MRSLGGENGTTELAATVSVLAILGVPLPVITLVLALVAIGMAGWALIKLDGVATDLQRRNELHAKAIAELRASPSGGDGDR